MSLRMIAEAAAQQVGRPEIIPLMMALGEQESGGSSSGDIVNPDSGARGPWQVMYPTAQMHGYGGSATELQRPEINALYAAKKIASDWDKYKGNIQDIAAAYYQGDNRRNADGSYGFSGDGKYPSTNDYVSSVLNKMGMAGAPMNFGQLTQQQPVPTPEELLAGGNADIDKLMQWLGQQKMQPELEQMFRDSMAENETRQAPAPQEVPARTSLGGRLLSTFAGGLGSSVANQPGYLRGAYAGQADVENQAREIEAQNSATQQDFEKDKEGRRRQLQDALFDLNIKELTGRGDTEKALRLMLTQGNINRRYKDAEEKAKANSESTKRAETLQNQLTRDKAREEERRKTYAERVSASQKKYGLPKEAAEELESLLDGIDKTWDEFQSQQGIMQGGPGTTVEDVAKILQAKAQAKAEAVATVKAKYKVEEPAAPSASPSGGEAAPEPKKEKTRADLLREEAMRIKAARGQVKS